MIEIDGSYSKGNTDKSNSFIYFLNLFMQKAHILLTR